MTTVEQNKIAGSGQRSHFVPSAVGHVVEIRDEGHDGTAVWCREPPDNTQPDSGAAEYMFASLDANTLESSDRCVLLHGQLIEEIGLGMPFGCDREADLALVGVDFDDDLSWISEGAAVLWDSHNV